jgi:hypothetical protein
MIVNENDDNNFIYYGNFDWIDYINKNNNLKINKKEEIYYEYIKEESKKNIPIYFNIPQKKLHCINFYTYNDLDVLYDDFEWESYIVINKDLKKNGINTKERAWDHWSHFGRKEERAFSLINNTNMNKGRFGNLFFANMYLHFISLRYDLKSNYKFADKFKKLGITFYSGKNIYKKNLLITKNNYLNILEKNYEPSNIIITNENWCQSNPFCLILQNYYNVTNIKQKIKTQNIFSNRYGINNDLFIHVRLGDISDKTQFLLSYYEKMLLSISYEKGYIASDSINSNFCKYLITKFNLYVIDLNDIETIMFGSTCNNIVLGGGSFSWLIGFLAFNSTFIYYPDNNKFETKWFGNIFQFSDWICVRDF